MTSNNNINLALQEIRRLTKGAKSLVFVSGNFNIVHPGHLRLLQFAASCGDFLIVGVNNQPSVSLTIPSQMRLEGVKAISLVNYAFLLEGRPENFIEMLRPQIVVKGKEFEGRKNPEKSIIESYGGKLIFGSGEVRFSSLDLLKREYLETNFSNIKKPTDYPERHGFTVPMLKEQIAKFNGMRVVVLGDLIVDEYIDCDPLGMSQEDPSIVVTPLGSKRFVGGAGIVAAHAKGLGADVSYYSIAGIDEPSDFAKRTLASYGVKNIIISDTSRPTTLKQRYRAAGKTLLRVSHLRQHDIRPEIIAAIKRPLLAELASADLLIFSDFNYGCLPQTLVDEIILAAKKEGIPLVADSQASSQLSDISRFRGMKLLTPTEREARLALRDWNSGLVVLAEALRTKAEAENVIITLGAEGILLHAKNKAGWETDKLPSFNSSPKDVAGAGDSFLTCASMASCAGIDIWQSAYLGALAAACQVSRVGNTPLTQSDLIAEIDYL